MQYKLTEKKSYPRYVVSVRKNAVEKWEVEAYFVRLWIAIMHVECEAWDDYYSILWKEFNKHLQK